MRHRPATCARPWGSPAATPRGSRRCAEPGAGERRRQRRDRRPAIRLRRVRAPSGRGAGGLRRGTISARCATAPDPEMLSYFSELLASDVSRGVENQISGVKLLQGDLAEAWREGNMEYATVAMRFELVDKLVDRETGRDGRGQRRASGGGRGVDLRARRAAASGFCRRSRRSRRANRSLLRQA